jgi:hypothetical protein
MAEVEAMNGDLANEFAEIDGLLAGRILVADAAINTSPLA